MDDKMAVIHELGHSADYTDPNGNNSWFNISNVLDAMREYKNVEIPKLLYTATGLYGTVLNSEAINDFKHKNENMISVCRKVIGEKIGIDLSGPIRIEEIGEILAETNVEWEDDPDAMYAWNALQNFADELNVMIENAYDEKNKVIPLDLPSSAELMYISDIFDALHAGALADKGILPAGHGSIYFEDETRRLKEIVANYFALSICSPHGVKLLNEMVPGLVSALKKYVAGLAR